MVAADRALRENQRKWALDDPEVEETIFQRVMDRPPERNVTSPTAPTISPQPSQTSTATSIPTPKGGVPSTLPPIPVSPTSTPPPTPEPGQTT